MILGIRHEQGLITPSDAIDFMRRHPLEWDLQLNREYYNDPADAPNIRSNLAKLARPRIRDLKTREISEYILKALPKELVEEAQRQGIEAIQPARLCTRSQKETTRLC